VPRPRPTVLPANQKQNRDSGARSLWCVE
jgi:hypothetical protein